ncbi:MAG: DUF2946 family protein [Methylocystis sp.]|uniref:DUF2946 family protein n=1 Tax=Methylocystis sp. TaxID=1911079 RepID=UPI003DA56F83
MRKSSLRALLLALVMVVQAIAGGFGAAHATPGVTGAALAHCVSAGGEADKAGNPSTRHQHCDACCLCAAPATASVPDPGPAPVAPRAFHVVGFSPGDARVPHARVSRSQFARGPPTDGGLF